MSVFNYSVINEVLTPRESVWCKDYINQLLAVEICNP